jgi:hypothetical protein
MTTMPFDSLQDHIETILNPNTLAAIGLRPVHPNVVKCHKAKVIEAFRNKGRVFATLIDNGMAAWRPYPLSAHCPNPADYSSYLNLLTKHETSTHDNVPPAITKLTEDVAANIQDAKFTVEYFDKDPILHVQYRDSTGRDHFECLAIWDRATVIAIASRDEPIETHYKG